MFGDNLQHHSHVQFWCVKGFVLRGSSSIQCKDGQWGAPFPVCEAGNYAHQNILITFTTFKECFWLCSLNRIYSNERRIGDNKVY